MSIFAQRFTEIAKSEVGVKELQKNFAPRIVAYQKTTTLDPGPWSWCAAFVAYCLYTAVREIAVADELVTKNIIPNRVSAVNWRCKSARAFAWIEWAEAKNLQVIENASALAKKGDIIVFDFSHIGVVIFDQRHPNEQIITMEGNTNIKGVRDGDGVYAKRRNPDPTQIACYIRIVP